MKIVNISQPDVVFDYTQNTTFINHPYTSLQLIYEDGNCTIRLDPQIEEEVDIDDYQINLWIPFLSVPEVESITTGYITSQLCEIPNILTVFIVNIKDISRVNDWILSSQPSGISKSIQFLGKPTMDIHLDGVINTDITQLNIPLNQNLMELYTNNPQLVSVGINGDSFGYWNVLPPIHLIIYTTSLINMKHIMSRMRDHSDKIILLR